MRVLTDEQKKWCEIISEYAKKEIEPIMCDYDKIVDPRESPWRHIKRALR